MWKWLLSLFGRKPRLATLTQAMQLEDSTDLLLEDGAATLDMEN